MIQVYSNRQQNADAMKRFKIYPYLLAVLFLFSGLQVVSAQGKNHKEQEKHRKDYYKQKDKDRKAYYKDREKDRKEYNKHANKYDKHRYSHNDRYDKKYKRNGPPHWAQAHKYHSKHHVYFRDYYTFYDPYRGGYVYRQSNGWHFSRSIPTFLINVDLGRARVQFIDDIPLNQHPERYYSRYSKRYPRDTRVRLNISIF